MNKYLNLPQKKVIFNLSTKSSLIQYKNINLISREELHEIWKNKPNKIHTVRMGGLMVPVPRTQVTFGKPYRFAGNVLEPEKEMPEFVTKCIRFVNILYPSVNWNGALVNFYKDGKQYIGAHSDDVRDLVPGTDIWSFSFGGQRTFRVRDKWTKEIIKDITTEDNSILVMSGEFQKEFTHEIVKTSKHIGRRLNVTVRAFS